MSAGNLVESDEDHGFVASVLGAMPDIGGYKSQVARRHLNFLIVDDFFAITLKVVFDGVAVGVEGAVDTAAANLPLEHPESVDVESQLRRDDPGEQVSFLLRGMDA